MTRSGKYIERRLREALTRAQEERLAENNHIISAWWGEMEMLIDEALDKLTLAEGTRP